MKRMFLSISFIIVEKVVGKEKKSIIKSDPEYCFHFLNGCCLCQRCCGYRWWCRRYRCSSPGRDRLRVPTGCGCCYCCWYLLELFWSSGNTTIYPGVDSQWYWHHRTVLWCHSGCCHHCYSSGLPAELQLSSLILD